MIEDFNFLYPENKNCLFETFPLYKQKILELAKRAAIKLRDDSLKSIITEYLDVSQGTVILFYFVFIIPTYNK